MRISTHYIEIMNIVWLIVFVKWRVIMRSLIKVFIMDTMVCVVYYTHYRIYYVTMSVFIYASNAINVVFFLVFVQFVNVAFVSVYNWLVLCWQSYFCNFFIFFITDHQLQKNQNCLEYSKAKQRYIIGFKVNYYQI